MAWLRSVIDDAPSFTAFAEQLKKQASMCTWNAQSHVVVSLDRREVVCDEAALALFDALLSLEHVEEIPGVLRFEDFVALSP